MWIGSLACSFLFHLVATSPASEDVQTLWPEEGVWRTCGPQSSADALAQKVRRVRTKTVLSGRKAMRAAEQTRWESAFPEIWQRRVAKIWQQNGHRTSVDLLRLVMFNFQVFVDHGV